MWKSSMWRFRSFLRVHVLTMSSSLQKPHEKVPFCFDAPEAMDAASEACLSGSWDSVCCGDFE
jgi:hypothetical protein